MTTSPGAIQKSAASDERAPAARPEGKAGRSAIDRLKRDHRVLRSKLAVIESALTMGPEARYVLREVCATLSRQLQHHSAREEQLVRACRAALDPQLLARMAVEHHDEPQHLQTIRRLFQEGHSHALERIAPALTSVIRGLRSHIAQEEAELFPLLERELHAREPAKPPQRPTRLLEACMTVNHLMHDYPQTKAVLERLLINPKYDGCTCLDEVAWQHGLDTEQLLTQLEQAIAAGGAPAAARRKDQAPCGCR